MVFKVVWVYFWLAKVCKFWNLKLFSGKPRQSLENFLEQNFDIGCALQNSFKAIFRWKTNVLSFWKFHSWLFLNFLMTKLQLFFFLISSLYMNLSCFLENDFLLLVCLFRLSSLNVLNTSNVLSTFIWILNKS